ncbi:hypothetical protein [Bradyrhizobium erythrophlei]|nr:hypothetical protein [Bradyrhizobium erythrophlei]
MNATLYGELGTIFSWMTRRNSEKSKKNENSRSAGCGSVGIGGCGDRI